MFHQMELGLLEVEKLDYCYKSGYKTAMEKAEKIIKIIKDN